MKKSILNIALSLVALLFVTSVIAQNKHWVSGPCSSSTKNSVTITGMAAGLGTGPYYAKLTGYYDCVNNGTNTPGSDNWSQLNVIVPVVSKGNGTGGNLKLTITLNSLCDHANWTFKTRDLVCTIYNNPNATGTYESGPTPVNACQ